MRLPLILSLLLACSAVAQAQQAPPPQPPREATIANETDQALYELYLFQPGQAEGADRLGANVLPPRAAFRVPLAGVRACRWELRAVLEDGEELRRHVNLCQSPRIRLAETGPRREVEVANDADQELRELYLGRPGSGERGRDRLGSSTVSPGERYRLRLRGSECVFDMQAVFTDETEEVRRGVDLCRTPRLAFGDPSLPVREAQVENRGRRTIRELYARRVGATGWGPDRLGTSIISPQEGFTLRVRAQECRFDLRAVFENDQEVVQEGVDLCAGGPFAFGQAPAGEARRVTLRNLMPRAIEQLYLSPTEDDEWGEDRLGERVLPPGESQVVAYEGGCQADLRLVFDNRAAEERREVDICATPVIALRPGWTAAETLEGGEAAPGAAPAGSGFRLRNAGTVPVVAVYADAPGTERGPNRLGTELAPGEQAELATTTCRADLVAVFADGHEMRLEGRELCGEELGVE
ncbi:hypothetical protein JYK14_15320 [Siccirubricoccus sp. KC 17139]|uniref:Uncharacterized protein n=1 Tax=Siccirubricoccus soli TaxID=2899147 RepID=A0ABT1D6H7_9PROT|nr:hypothetical protein [Siccirubricoccus soli]MCO6417521.1 hypothetical protein [Siccirubricoccus soli]MCP2683656.1 hypothetical protein [Siccirubricoccus soli]